MSHLRFATNRLELLFLLFAALFLYLHLYQLPGTPFFYENDQFVALHEAVRMNEGEVMYRDFFDIIFPGSTFLYAVLFKFFGNSYWVLNAVIFFIGFISTWLCLRLSQKIIPGALAFLPPMIYLFFGFRWLGLDGSCRMMSPIAIIAAILLLLDKRTPARLVGAGAACAAASFFTQQRGLIGIFALALFLLGAAYFQKDGVKQTFISLIILSGSFAATLLVLCGYFVLAAGFENFYYATLVHSRLYYRSDPHNNFNIFLSELLAAWSNRQLLVVVITAFYYLTPLAYVVFLILFALKRGWQNWEFWRKPFLIALMGGFVALTTAIAPTALRLFQVSIPALVLLVWLVAQFEFGKFIKPLAYALLFILPLTAITMMARQQTYADTKFYQLPSGRVAVYLPDSFARHVWLLEHTKPGDYIFEVYQPSVYFPLALRNPSKMLINRDNGFTTPEHAAQILRDLKAQPPKFILWDNNWNKASFERRADDNLAPLYDYLNSEYQPASPVFDYSNRAVQIYKRK